MHTILIGTLILLLAFYLVALALAKTGLQRLARRQLQPLHHQQEWPAVAIIVAARNEAISCCSPRPTAGPARTGCGAWSRSMMLKP